MSRKKKYIVLNTFEQNDRRLIRLYARRAGMEYEEFAIYLKLLRDNPITYEIKFETLPTKAYVKLEKVASKRRVCLLVFSNGFIIVFSNGFIRSFSGKYQEGKYFNKEDYRQADDKVEKFFGKTLKDSSASFLHTGVDSIFRRIWGGLTTKRELIKELLISSLRDEKPEFLKFTLRELYDKNSSYSYSSELSDVKTAIFEYIENRKEDILIEGLENCSVLDTTVEEVVSNYLIFQKFDAVKND